YVYVGDVARANVLAATRPLPPAGALDSRSFNIGTGVETSVIQLAQLLHDVCRTDAAIEHAPDRAGEVRRSALDNTRARDILGWSPNVSLAEGVAETFQWFAAERDAVSGAA
ncbi:MAG TPA: GDP-mannose 4,6-dehydratase, partial [Candidatus Elarobacter sp.]|nr:GDP-mannose 4,6-dehydratase [Candidatus Elarobacter sp.]